MADDSFKIKKSINLEPKSSPSLTAEGDIAFDSSAGELKVRDSSTTRSVVTKDGTQTLSGKTLADPVVTGQAKLADGSVSAPGASFSSDLDTGFYRIGANDIGFAVGGHLGLEVKDNGTYGNVGLGSTPSASSSYPVLISRSNASVGTTMQIANPATDANSKGSIQVSTDNGNVQGEISAYTAASTVDAYVSALVIRATDSAAKTVIAGPYVTFYANADLTSTGEIARFNADKSLQFMQEISTPSTPSAGLKVYTKSDKKLYKLDTLGNETEVGSGGSSGINYMSANPSAESATTGWTLYEDAAATSPVDGTGVATSSEITWTRTTSSPLRGSASFLLTKDAANRQGEGVSYDFTIDAADQGQVLEVSFDYKVASGTYASSDLSVWIYNVTDAVLVQPTPYTLLNASVASKWKGSFQTSTTSTSYRLIIHVGSTSASAYTVKFDNFALGPQVKTYGPYISDWVAYTPTGAWSSNTTYTGFYRYVGDSLELDIKVATSGAPTSASLTVNLPSGITIDTAKLTDSTAGVAAIQGIVSIRDSSPADVYEGVIKYNSTTSIAIFKDDGDGTESAVTQAAPITFASGDFVHIKAKGIPVAGKSSSMLLSSDADARIVAANAYRSGTQTVGPNASAIQIQLNSISASGGHGYDTHGAFDTVTNYRYNVPMAGYYQVNACVDVGGTNVLNNNYWAVIYRNGSAAAYGCVVRPPISTTFTAGVSGVIKCDAGDYLDLRLYGTGNNSASTLTVQSSASSTYMDIFKLSGPSQIAASEFVGCKYQTNAGNAVANNTITYIDFEDKVYDTHGMATSGTGNVTTTNTGFKVTVPAAGKYRVSALLNLTTGGGWSAGEEFDVEIRVDNVNAVLNVNHMQATHTTYATVQASTTVNLVAGQRIEVTGYQLSGASINLRTTTAMNEICVERIGL